ncbi:hypothetical protein BCR41DRAFT_360194 [Lobosporangium transversale]|uniref:Uncharacterized protein n=1 Tax=Lobosporangium transversale TaxID=64571 RepID=A0A1Y2GCN8_9FUNG|nr:hypothetical protein BCR41DRAFT_360194 [Lobosporangium transversale]ORZ07210.1 hypothetical protein BCR41DRAFT_360194 [Lobosporangium transversale]|eukprot:XP_021877873.1 hypothetical protein BCR41DRAFT_360194 [Lobosporangium transversale]
MCPSPSDHIESLKNKYPMQFCRERGGKSKHGLQWDEGWHDNERQGTCSYYIYTLIEIYFYTHTHTHTARENIYNVEVDLSLKFNPDTIELFDDVSADFGTAMIVIMWLGCQVHHYYGRKQTCGLSRLKS